MRVLLISANTEQINMPVLPLGMACVAAAAQNAGHEVQTVNLMMQKDVRTPIARAIQAFSPEVIGISVRNIDDQFMETPTFLLNSVRDVVSICRSLSNAPIVLGGAGYSIFPKTALEYLGADMGIQGEGEAAFILLLEQLRRNADLSGIPGLYLPGAGTLEKPPKKPIATRNLDEFPIPLPNIHLSPHTGIEENQLWIPFQTRRGCPMDCSYCSTATIEGRILRKFSPQKAVEGLRRYAEAGFRQFFFVDNTFNLPPSYAKALCDAIIAAGLNIRWRCILYPWKADDALIGKMARAGCSEVSFGFESGSEKILKNLNKRFTPHEVVRISETLQKHGIRQMGFLLLGGPGETPETVAQSLHFADALQLEAMKVTTGIRIYPYTALARIAISEGLIASETELIFPHFYVAKNLRDRLIETVSNWMKDRPNWLK
ncbi:MAG: radical SAM protein [Deltaproteobacteria bacterium]|nr:radical SAM protein [Deltaproteobacteria bacterium]